MLTSGGRGKKSEIFVDLISGSPLRQLSYLLSSCKMSEARNVMANPADPDSWPASEVRRDASGDTGEITLFNGLISRTFATSPGKKRSLDTKEVALTLSERWRESRGLTRECVTPLTHRCVQDLVLYGGIH